MPVTYCKYFIGQEYIFFWKMILINVNMIIPAVKNIRRVTIMITIKYKEKLTLTKTVKCIN